MKWEQVEAITDPGTKVRELLWDSGWLLEETRGIKDGDYLIVIWKGTKNDPEILGNI